MNSERAVAALAEIPAPPSVTAEPATAALAAVPIEPATAALAAVPIEPATAALLLAATKRESGRGCAGAMGLMNVFRLITHSIH